MTDVEFVYKQDMKERNSQKSGAAHKVNGSKSKGCKLPMDNLTKSEIKHLNGPVVSYKLKDFYTWSEYILLPKDIQSTWINSIIEKYQLSIPTICKYLFKTSYNTVYRYLNREGIEISANHGKRPTKCDVIRFRSDVDNFFNSNVVSENEIEINDVSEESYENLNTDSVSHMSINMNSLDQNVFDVLKQIFNDKNVNVSITVEVID